MNQFLSSEVQICILSYFNSKHEDERKRNWNKLMTYFQLYIDEPQFISFRIIKSREKGHPILIFNNTNNETKLLIPLIPNRIIKLNLSSFVETGIRTDLLRYLTFDNRKYKVYNDIHENKKPVVYESIAS